MKRLGVGLIGIAMVAALLAPSFAGERDTSVVTTKTAARTVTVVSAPAPPPRSEAVRSQASSTERDRMLLLLLMLGARTPGSER